MSAALHLAAEADLDRLLPLVAAYHDHENIEQSDEVRREALRPLLEGSPHGAIWLIGPRRAPVGYVVVSFGWSVEFGGMDGFVDEFYIRASVRGRGMGGEVLARLQETLREAGVRALHLEVARDNDRALKLYERSGFRLRDGHNLMSWRV